MSVLAILLLLVCVSLYLLANNVTSDRGKPLRYDISYEAYKNYQGFYYAYDLVDNIFAGNVKLQYIKTPPRAYNSNILLIYDEKKHGLLCRGINEKADIYLQCFPVMTISDNINANSISSEVVTAIPNMEVIFIIRLQQKINGLFIYGHPLTAKCGTDSKCDKLISALTNTKKQAEAMKRSFLTRHKATLVDGK